MFYFIRFKSIVYFLTLKKILHSTRPLRTNVFEMGLVGERKESERRTRERKEEDEIGGASEIRSAEK